MRYQTLLMSLPAALLAAQAHAAIAQAAPSASASTSPPIAAAAPAAQTAGQDKSRCAPAPGTSTAPSKGACFGNLGSSYNAEQLNATGASNPGQALHLLDPSVTVRN